MKNTFLVKFFGILIILVLILTALAPVFQAFAPQYIPTPTVETGPPASDVPSE